MSKLIKAVLLAGLGAMIGVLLGNLTDDMPLLAMVILFMPIPVGFYYTLGLGWSFGSPMNILLAFPNIFLVVISVITCAIRFCACFFIGYVALAIYVIGGILDIAKNRDSGINDMKEKTKMPVFQDTGETAV